MLVGRAAELERIDDVLSAARGGRSRALVLRGEAGIGKTALLDWAAGRYPELAVLRAVGVESEAELACAGLHALLRPLLAHLDDLPARQAAALRAALAIDATASTDRFGVYVGTLGLLAAAAERGPLLCLVDDAHWLDSLSAEALVFAARRLDAEPVAMLFAARTGERPFPAIGLPELAIGPLDDASSAALLARDGRRLGDEPGRRLLRLAAGNPLALLELPRRLSDAQLVGAAPLEDPVPVSEVVEAAFRARLERLSGPAQHALLLAAACDSDVATAAAGDGLVAALEEAERSGLVHLEGDAVRFRHPLVRAATYQRATPAERRSAHAELAAGLAGLPDEQAWQLASAAASPDERVAALLDEAAARAGRRGSMAARARALARAAELTPDPQRRAGRLVDAARAAFEAGHSAVASAAIAEADALADDPVLRADVALVRWDVESTSWDRLFPSFVRAAEEVIGSDPHRAARMLSSTTDYLHGCGRTADARAMHERAWALAERRPQPGLLGVAVDEAWARLEDLRPEGAVAAALAALAAGAGSTDPGDLEELPHGAQVLVFAEHPAAGPQIDALVDRARVEGAMPVLCAALADRADLELREGRLHAAYATAAEAHAIAETVGGWRALWAGTSLAEAEAYLGHEAACREHAAAALDEAAPATRWWRACAHRALGALALGLRELEAAEHHLALAGSLIPLRHPGFFHSQPDHAEALLRTGRTREGLELLADIERRAERAALPRTLGAARRCRLLVAGEDEVDGLGRALLDAAPPPTLFEAARVRLFSGERLRRLGRRVDARAQLAEALDAFEQLGARPWAAQARRELDASGARLRKRAAGEVEALTPQELQIALAVAEGRTNREVGAALFISPKTVELHLSRVYRKLEIRSRGELIRLQAADPGRLRLA
jgi:DNA-binding CsgD family transcriptional regulator